MRTHLFGGLAAILALTANAQPVNLPGAAPGFAAARTTTVQLNNDSALDPADTPVPAAIVDFAVPENAAAAILNSSIAATKPTTPRDLVAGLSSIVDKDGNIKPGVSLAFLPYRLFKNDISADEFKNGTLKFLSRAQVSAGTAAVSASDTSKGSLASLGLNLIFIDQADPREAPAVDRNFASLFKTAPGMPINPDDTGSSYELVDSPAAQSFSTSLQKFRKDNWNARSLGAGLALRRLSTAGSLRKAKDDGWAGWLTYADRFPGDGLMRDSLVLINVQYRAREKVDNAGTLEERDTLRSGLQIRMGSPDINGYAEVFYRRVSTKGAGHKSEWSAEAGLEYRVHDGTWLNISWVDDVNGAGDSGVKTGLRLGIGPKKYTSAAR